MIANVQMENNKVAEIIIKFRKLNYDIELLLLELKNLGLSQFETTKLLHSELGFLLTEAGNLVLNSEAWKDYKPGNLKLRKLFLDSL